MCLLLLFHRLALVSGNTLNYYRTLKINIIQKSNEVVFIYSLPYYGPFSDKNDNCHQLKEKYTVIQHCLKIVMDHFTYLLLMDQFSPDTERTTYGHQ